MSYEYLRQTNETVIQKSLAFGLYKIRGNRFILQKKIAWRPWPLQDIKTKQQQQFKRLAGFPEISGIQWICSLKTVQQL